jgi:hypothetical protein
MWFPLVALAGEEPKVKETGEAGRCDMSMNIGWFARQDVSVKPGRVVGPDFNLHIEDNVIYGFIRGKATRFKVKKDSVSGSAAGFDLMLHVNKSDFETEVRGLVGNRRVVAKVSDEKISAEHAARPARSDRCAFHGLAGRLIHKDNPCPRKANS